MSVLEKERPATDPTYHLNSLIARFPSPIPTQHELDVLPNILSAKELTTALFVARQIQEADNLVRTLYDTADRSLSLKPIRLHFCPRLIHHDPSTPDTFAISPTALTLDALLQVTNITYRAFLSAKVDDYKGMATKSMEVSVRLSNLLFWLLKAHSSEVEWNDPEWVQTKQGKASLHQTAHLQRKGTLDTYFTPGRSLFSFEYVDNSRRDTDKQKPITKTGFRINEVHMQSTRQATIEFDVFSNTDLLVECSSRKGKQKRVTDRLIDSIFGPDKHHVLLLTTAGLQEDQWSKTMTELLNIPYLFCTIQDIPPEIKYSIL